MAEPQFPKPVKLITAILWNDEYALETALQKMISKWGQIDFQGITHPFSVTNYYEPEMGKNLKRRIISFLKLIPPENIRDIKILSNQIEIEIKNRKGRSINLDVGFLDHNKVVLASAKYGGQKIHLGKGIYADMILRFKNGTFKPFEWTFMDFRNQQYDKELLAIKRIYLKQIKPLSIYNSSEK